MLQIRAITVSKVKRYNKYLWYALITVSGQYLKTLKDSKK